jgi:hypothetical protein
MHDILIFIKKRISHLALMVIFFHCQFAFGQKTTAIPTDSLTAPTDSIITIEKPKFSREIAVFVELLSEYAPRYSGNGWSDCVSIGMTYEGFSAGLLYFNNSGAIENQPFFPRQLILPYRQYGGYLSKSILRKGNFRSNLKLNASYGEMIWKNKKDDTNEFLDHFYIIKPELELTYTFLRIIQITASGGYRFINDLNLPEISNTNYQGLTFNTGVRIGFFYKPTEK